MRMIGKKLFALLLCFAMLYALLPAFAAAEEEVPDEITESEAEDAEQLVLAPTGEEKGVPLENSTVIDEEFAFNRNCFYEITTPGETVFRPVTAEDDGYFKFHIKTDHVHLLFTDSEFNVLFEAETVVDYAKELMALTYRDGGQTYYVGVSYQDPQRTGSFNVAVYQYGANACGDYVTWSFDEDSGELSLSSGTMWDFTPETVPWRAYRDRIKTLRISTSGSTVIGEYAFYGCSNLESIENNKSIGAIAGYAFYGTALRKLEWPDFCWFGTYGGVGEYAFAYCKNLKTFYIRKDNSTYSIGDYAFYGSGLESAIFVNNLPRIGSYAFAECKNLETVSLPNEVTMDGYGLTLGDYVFQNSGLQTLQIPKIVTEIGVGPFAGCKRLAPNALTVANENETFIAKDGLLLTKDGKTLRSALYQTASGAYTTPSSVRTIADSAFYGCGALTELKLSSGVVTVGENAFTDCAALQKITVLQSLKQVNRGAFSGCGALSDVYYLGYEEEREAKLSVEPDGNDALLNAVWHYTEKSNFDGTVEWDPNDVQFKGTTPYVTYTGEAFTPRFTLKDAAGNTVDESAYTVEYLENTEPGTGYAVVTFTEGYTGSFRSFFKIYLPATTETKVENVSDGVRIRWKPVENAAGYVIYRRAWNLQSAGWTTFERWNNTTDTTWTDTKVYAGTRYQYGVKAYFERRNDAVTGAEIGGNVGDNFNLGHVGPLKTTVRITTRHLKTLAPAKNAITATWDTSKVFTGYQVRYATDEAFTKNAGAVKVGGAANEKTVLKSLKANTVYYVSVRSYHEFEGMTYFGEWSNVIRVKTGTSQTVYDVMYRAVAVGENKYKESPLKGCVNDANAMTGMLKGLNRPFAVKTVTNGSKTAIINAIRTSFADAMDSDVSLFCYSGHGVNASGDSDSEYDLYQGALVSTDMEYITMRELAAELSKVRGRVIVILDSCHSGASIARSEQEQEAELEAFRASAIEAFSGYYLEDTAKGGETSKMGEFRQSKFIVIVAASYWQSSYDGKFDGSGYSQGAFTAAIIKGMGCSYPNGKYLGSMPADANKDKKVTLYELFNYANSQAKRWSPRQDAQYFGPDDEVLFRR